MKRKGHAAPAVATQPPREIESAERGARAYPSAAEYLASPQFASVASLLRGVLSGACVVSALAIGATGCGTPAQASSPQAPVAVLAPMAPVAPHGAKPSEPVATLVPLPPPPPLPENMPAPTTPPPPTHHPRPRFQHHFLGGVMAAPQPQPVPVSGGAPAVDLDAVY